MRRLDGAVKRKEVARTEHGDIPELVEVCRQSFPNSTRWQGAPLVARRWWKKVMSVSSAGLYILRSEGQIAAFWLLITDENSVKKQMLLQPIALWLRLFSVVTCPMSVLRKD